MPRRHCHCDTAVVTGALRNPPVNDSLAADGVDGKARLVAWQITRKENNDIERSVWGHVTFLNYGNE